MAPMIIDPHRFGGGGGFIQATGGTMTCDGEYQIHTFTAPGTFTVCAIGVDACGNNVDTIEYIMVGGGGGGGGAQPGPARSSGGGGAGEAKIDTSYTVSVGCYAICIGAGGCGATSHAPGDNGGSTTFGSFTVIGGGGGGRGGNSSLAGITGGSGGGSGSNGGAGGAATATYLGEPGGAGTPAGPSYGGGAGGGASSAGHTFGYPGPLSGTGGAGVYFAGSYYAGGGGAGTALGPGPKAGGVGGGGAGGKGPGSTGGNATANTGGGGGGSGGYGPAHGGDGSDGVVIIRYPIASTTPPIGGWVEVGRTTLGSTGDTIDVSSLPDKRYYMVLQDIQVSGSANALLRFNSDSGTNYSRRWQNDGGSDGSSTNSDVLKSSNGWNTREFAVGYVANLAGKEKLWLQDVVSDRGSGAGTANSRAENTSKWANTSSAISSLNYFNDTGGDFASGTEVVVLGWDPADTHTCNFWEELASVELSTSAATIDTTAFTAKKYLWIQYHTTQQSATANGLLQVGNSTIDTGSNYSWRRSVNGGTDGTFTSQSSIAVSPNQENFANVFVINNASQEKFFIGHSVEAPTAGADTAPERTEVVGKWANTSNQINRIQLNSSGTFASGSFIKVWGSD